MRQELLKVTVIEDLSNENVQHLPKKTAANVLRPFIPAIGRKSAAILSKHFGTGTESQLDITVLSLFRNVDRLAKFIEIIKFPGLSNIVEINTSLDIERDWHKYLNEFFATPALLEAALINAAEELADRGNVDTLTIVNDIYRHVIRQIQERNICLSDYQLGIAKRVNEKFKKGKNNFLRLEEELAHLLRYVPTKSSEINVITNYRHEDFRLGDEIDGYTFKLPAEDREILWLGYEMENALAHYIKYVMNGTSIILPVIKDGKTVLVIEIRNGAVTNARKHRNCLIQPDETDLIKALATYIHKHQLSVDTFTLNVIQNELLWQAVNGKDVN